MNCTIFVEIIMEHNAVWKTNITVNKSVYANAISYCLQKYSSCRFVPAMALHVCLSLDPSFNCGADHGNYFLINAANSPVFKAN